MSDTSWLRNFHNRSRTPTSTKSTPVPDDKNGSDSGINKTGGGGTAISDPPPPPPQQSHSLPPSPSKHHHHLRGSVHRVSSLFNLGGSSRSAKLDATPSPSPIPPLPSPPAYFTGPDLDIGVDSENETYAYFPDRRRRRRRKRREKESQENSGCGIWKSLSDRSVQMVETLQAAMMARRDPLTPIPNEYDPYIRLLIESFAEVMDELRIVEHELAELKSLREKELEQFRGISEEWIQRENNYKAEIKRLELLLVKESKEGVACVALARHGTLVDRSGTKRFLARVKRMSNPKDQDLQIEQVSINKEVEEASLTEEAESNTLVEAAAAIPRTIDSANDVLMSRAIEQRERDERNKRRHQHQHAAAVYLDPLGTNTPITGTGNPHRGYRLRQQHSQELANQYAQTAFNRAEAHRHHQEHTVSGHDRDLPSEYRSNQFLHADDGGDFPPQRRHFSTSSSSTTSAASTTSTASSPGLPVPESDQQEVSTLPVPGDQVVNSELDLSGQPITNNDLSEWVKLQSYTESNHTIADGNEEIERSGPSSQPLLAEREGPPDSPHPSRGRRPSPVGPRRHSRSRSLEPRLDGTGLATISSRNGTAKKGTLAPSLSPRSRPSTARNSILVSTASIPLRDALASSTSTGSVDTVVWLGLNNEKRDDRGSRQAPPQDYFSLRIDNRQDREELEGCSGSSGGNSRGTVIWQRERERERDTVTPTPASIRSSRSSRSYGTPFGGGTPHRATLATPPTLVSPSGPDAMVSGSRDVGSAERGAYSRSSTSNSMKRSPGPSRPQTPSRSEVTAAEAARLAAARAVAHVYQRDRKLEQHGSM